MPIELRALRSGDGGREATFATIASRTRQLVRVPVNGVGRERGRADREILGAVRLGCTVTDPFAARTNYCLPGMDVDDAPAMFNAQRAAYDYRELVEFRRLSRLLPSARALHLGHAQFRSG